MFNNSNRFFWRISLTLMGVLIIMSIAYTFISVKLSQQYWMEANQELYGTLADYAAMQIDMNDSIQLEEVHGILKMMSKANPGVGIYLLNAKGKVELFAGKFDEIARYQVDLTPIETFINSDPNNKPFILGEDPHILDCQLPFSAAKTKFQNGYVYVILANTAQANINARILNSYILRIGFWAFLAILVGAIGLGFWANWYTMRNLRNITDRVRSFKEGDYSVRIADECKRDFVEVADTFNAMAEQIEANINNMTSLENFRRELIANVSHDLRTPLSIMQGYVETMLMKSDKLTGNERDRYLKIVLNSSQKLSRLVAQLFEYSKLEAQQIEPHKEPFFMAELAQDVFAKYEIIAEEKDIQLKLDMRKDLPLVFADVALVERAMQNLIDNALKFTPKGGCVTIALQQKKEGVEVRIADTGQGIPIEEQAYIFERYHRANKAKEKSEGAGLGLAIAKKIMEIHEANLQVQSAENEGCEFWFVLPAYQA